MTYKFRSPIYKGIKKPINLRSSTSCEHCFFPKDFPHDCNGDMGDLQTIKQSEVEK